MMNVDDSVRFRAVPVDDGMAHGFRRSDDRPCAANRIPCDVEAGDDGKMFGTQYRQTSRCRSRNQEGSLLIEPATDIAVTDAVLVHTNQAKPVHFCPPKLEIRENGQFGNRGFFPNRFEFDVAFFQNIVFYLPNGKVDGKLINVQSLKITLILPAFRKRHCKMPCLCQICFKG